MTTLDITTDIPTAINSLTIIHAWSGLALQELYRGQQYKEAAGSSIDSGLAPLIDTSRISAADGTDRLIIRAALELDPAYVTDNSQKLWMFVRPFGSVVLPAAYKID